MFLNLKSNINLSNLLNKDSLALLISLRDSENQLGRFYPYEDLILDIYRAFPISSNWYTTGFEIVNKELQKVEDLGLIELTIRMKGCSICITKKGRDFLKDVK